MAGLTVADICAALERRYPSALAEDWDSNGLFCGDPAAPVTSVLFAVDPADAVIAEAAETGSELLVTHHPLLLRGVHGVTASTPKGRRLLALVRAGISAYNVHTPADSASPGVSDAVADLLGLTDVRPLAPTPRAIAALSTPVVRTGIGRVGTLGRAESARDVAARLASALPATVSGVKIGGDPERSVRRVAILAGAGDSHLDAAREAGADLYVTSDLRHHPAEEALAWDDAPVLVDVPHWACEWAWLPKAAQALREDLAGHRVTVRVSTLRTEPWSLRV
jgi:dinuclear metal center YbgI/SA1388 family protein